MDTTPPLPVVPLGYHDGAAEPWSAVVRLMAVGAAVQGFAGALAQGWQVAAVVARAGGPFAGSRADQVGLGVELLRVGTDLGLGIAAWLAVHRRAVGRLGVLWLEWVAIGWSAVQAGLSIWQWELLRGRVGPGMWIWMSAAASVVNLPSGVLLPALMLAFFRRPQVRAVCDRR